MGREIEERKKYKTEKQKGKASQCLCIKFDS